MEKIKIGVVGLARGCELMNLFKLDTIDATVTAACETSETVLGWDVVKNSINDIKLFDDYEEMLDSGLVNAVVLANYFTDHADFAIKAIERGIAVLSETTAAPSLGKCVDLVETVEKCNGKYMLAANCIYYPGIHAMKKFIAEKTYGEMLSGDSEYLHGGGHPHLTKLDKENLHWRQTMPVCYYNMHSLGPMMYITDSAPVKVSCKPTYSPAHAESIHYAIDSTSSRVTVEMSNGAVLTTTGCNVHYPSSKWFRVCCTDGAMETVRYDGSEKDLVVAQGDCDKMSTIRYDIYSSGVVSPDDKDYVKGAASGSGHGGVDYFVAYYFIQYLKGKIEPFFDVYRSVALSATGIIGWYSALTDSKEYKIPDFRKKEDRDKVRGDYRMPFAKRYEDLTLPCRLDEKDKFEGFEF